MLDADDQHEESAIPPALPATRERHEKLAAIEREIAALLGARTRRLPQLLAELRALL